MAPDSPATPISGIAGSAVPARPGSAWTSPAGPPAPPAAPCTWITHPTTAPGSRSSSARLNRSLALRQRPAIPLTASVEHVRNTLIRKDMLMRKALVIAGIAGALAIGGGTTTALADSGDGSPHTAASGTISRAHAEHIALKRVPGARVVET